MMKPWIQKTENADKWKDAINKELKKKFLYKNNIMKIMENKNIQEGN